jgi:hypothetical protein
MGEPVLGSVPRLHAGDKVQLWVDTKVHRRGNAPPNQAGRLHFFEVAAGNPEENREFRAAAPSVRAMVTRNQ